MKYFEYIKFYRKNIGNSVYIGFAFILIAGVLEGFGISMFFPLFQEFDGVDVAAFSSDTSILNSINRLITEVLESLGVERNFISILLFMTVVFSLKGVLTFLAHLYFSKTKKRLFEEVRLKLIKSLEEENYQKVLNQTSGEYVNLLLEQVTRVVNGYHSLVQTGIQAFMSVVYLVFAMIVDWKFGVLSFLFGLMLLFIFKYLSTFIRKMSLNLTKENSQLATLAVEQFSQYKYLTATGQFYKIKKRSYQLIEKISNTQYNLSIGMALSQSSREPLAIITLSLIIILLSTQATIESSQIIVSIILLHRAVGSTLSLQGWWQNAMENSGSIEIISNNLFNRPTNEKERNNNPFNSEIIFDKVCFQYENVSTAQIDNVSLKIPEDKLIGIVGLSGSGKTTFVNMLTCLLSPTDGQLMLGGVDATSINVDKWRSYIGYVTQNSVVFNGSIIQNITLSFDPNGKHSINKVLNIIESVGLSDFVNSLDNGINSMLGPNGIELSGGQLQRLAIARELFRDPKILILDEATSALDANSEDYIKGELARLYGKLTIIVISHDINLLSGADMIYVLDKGRILDNGPYSELFNKKSSYLHKMKGGVK